MNLRNYQTDLINGLRQSFKTGHKRPICVAGCGVGKTVLAAYMCEHHKGHVWFLVHRRELIEQTEHTFIKVPNNVTIAMVQTVSRNIDKYPKPTLIIFDECHHCMAKQWLKIINKYDAVPIVGLTATPVRLDGKPLGDIFDDIIFAPDNKWMIDNKYLAPFKYYAPDINLEDANWKIKGNDYDMQDVSEKLDKPAIYGNVLKYIDYTKKTIIYCPSIKYSQALAERIGPLAKHLDGNTSDTERKNIVKAFRDGNIRILLNVDLFGEGFDVPDCDCCILLRPTMSVSLYIQQTMRCMRYKPNKTAIIYDLVGNVFKHGMITDNREWSLFKSIRIKKSEDKELLVRECKHCLRIYKGNGRICPYCGNDNGMTKKQIKELQEKELQEIVELNKKKARQEVGMCKTESQLIELAKRRGYKNPTWWARNIIIARKNKIKKY